MITINKQNCNAKGPYDRCLDCVNLGNGCDGPRTNAMTIERWCAWMKALKQRREYSIPYIAQHTGLSRGTLENIFSGTTGANVGRTTMQLLENFLIGSAGQWPCAMELSSEEKVVYMDKPETLEALRERSVQIDNLRSHINDFKSIMDKEVALVRSEYEDNMTFLREQIERKDAIIAKLLEAAK